MKAGHIPLMCVSVLFATIASTTSAYATTYVIVLLDATGSMLEPTNNQTRFQEAAFNAAKELKNMGGDVRADVYTFHDIGAGLTLTEYTNGFVATDVNINTGNPEVPDVIGCVGGVQDPSVNCSALPPNLLKPGQQFQFPVTPTGGTPLAAAMCESFNTLVATGTNADSRTLIISSDGLENASTGTCHGDLDAVYNQAQGQWPSGSWQRNVIDYFKDPQNPQNPQNRTVLTDAVVFQAAFVDFPFGPTPDLEVGFSSRAPAFSMNAPAFAISAAAATGISPLQQFFLSLAQATGGRVRVFTDNQPPPLFGDVNGGQCVDITDAIDVARAFGQPAFGSDFDLSVDGKIGFDDYQLVTRSATPGCGTANPYTPRDPVVCEGSSRIVIDSQSVADGGITIDVRGACDITIKNSFIVSGQNAITIVGSAVVTVDNSIIVGENAVITQHGSGVLSAANSVFHGTIDTQGAFQYIDRGGNKFE